MFKLESYITPLLLGYVNKYIKNLKSEDFQLSLWGGDAVLTNLDLRLDVLEEEFHLPFTFTNGHIHELRIHVPWTKLGSEPIVITIETIECVLTLKGTTDQDGSKNQKTNQEKSKKKLKKAETPEAPPGYVQGFISKIINNISIVCNNLILKYVEDDIVLSLNIKSAEMYNVNNSWEKAFMELSIQNPTLRRVINMHDLTMCLDKRNASGIIEVYQDPLLFRCSAWCRLYTAYENPHSKLATTTHVSVFCEQLDFSITDQQLPMLFRLIQLCIALFYGEISQDIKMVESGSEKEDKPDLQEGFSESVPSGWGSWAWSYVPQILPVWDENDEAEEGNYQKSLATHIFQFRLLVERTSLVFKSSEFASQSSKLAFHSMALARLYGTSIGLTIQGNRFVNSQLGVTAAELTNMDSCICGGLKKQENDKVYFQSGVMPGDGHTFSFLTASLFDPLSPENCSNGSQEIIVEWEKHLSYLTESVMNERYPSFAFDFLYDLEIPSEWSEKGSDFTASFLETSNWHERSLCRVIVGKACINVTSSLIHLIRYINNCGMDHDYAPYYATQNVNTSKPSNHTEEDVMVLQDFVPTRNIHILWHQPLIRIQMADHQCVATSSKDKPLRKQKSQKQLLKEESLRVPLLLSATLIEIQLSGAFYPVRLNAITSSLTESLPAELMQHCYNHAHAKIFNLEVLLHSKPQMPIVIVPPFSIAAYKKSIFFPQFWEKHSSFTLAELFLEVDRWMLQLSKSQAIYLGCLFLSWYRDAPIENSLITTLLDDIANKRGSLLSINICGLNIHSVETFKSLSYQGTLSSVKVSLDNEGLKTILFNAPEDATFLSNPYSTLVNSNSIALSIDNFIYLTVQLPKDRNSIDSLEPTVMVFKLQGFILNFDPEILSWLELSVEDIYVDAPSPKPIIQSVSSAASSHSNEMSSTYSLGRTMSANTLGANLVKKNLEETTVSSSLVSWYHILKQATILIDIQSGCILCPTTSFPQNPEATSLLRQWIDFNNVVKQASSLVFSTPRIQISSHGSGLDLDQDIPILINKPDEAMKFPWTLKFHHFSLSTLGLNTNHFQYLLKPMNASLTLAVTDSVSQLSFCVHLDLESLYISITKEQIVVVTFITDQALNCVHQAVNTWSWLTALLAMPKSSNNSSTQGWLVLPTTFENEQSVELGKEALVSPVSEYLTAIDVCQDSAVKLTMWLQCTLPKLGVSLFSEEKEGIWLQLEAEELTASLDVQDVFIKGKAKVTLFTISIFKKCVDSEEWKPGPFEGAILCGGDKLTRNMSVPSHLANNWHSYQQQNISQKNVSFLSLTYTRVLNSSVEKFWAKKLKDLPFDSKSANKDNVNEALENKPKYISEFDIKMDQFDLVLWLPLLTSIGNILSPLTTLTNHPLLSLHSSNSPTQRTRSLINQLNVQNLPLIYLQMGGMRCFLPSVEGENPSQPIDVCIVQIGKIVLVPQAENTLCRILINDTFYKAAEKAGTLGVPGSLVEDRQYQMDLKSLSLTGASWKNIRDRSKISCRIQSSNASSLTTLGQNPAVEWNNGLLGEEKEEEKSVILQPILMPVDIRIVAAPAIICWTGKNPDSPDVLVCGHSLELNAVSNLDIYLSFQQLSLISDILKDNLIKSDSATANVPKKSVTAPYRTNVTVKDSGIESEVADLAFASILTDSMLLESEHGEKDIPAEILLTANKVALMIFIHESDLKYKMKTISINKKKFHRRNKINFGKTGLQPLSPLQEDRLSNGKRKKPPRTSKKNAKPEIQSNESSPERIIIQPSSSTRKHKVSNTTVDSSEDGYEGSNDSSSSCPQRFQSEIESKGIETLAVSTKSSNHKIHPFLYLVFSQPHTFISWRADTQTLQISCFDLIIKSGRHNYFIDVIGPIYCPLPSHFPVQWLETKPGDTNPKTGIPPALVTITIKDFLAKPAGISVNMERPSLLHFSLNRWDQFNAVTSSAVALLNPTTDTQSNCDAPSVTVEERVKGLFDTVKSVSLSTIQIVLIVEGPPNLLEQQIALSVSGFNTSSELLKDKGGKHWNTDFKLKDFQLKINSSSNQSRHVIGPLISKFTYKTSWPNWNEGLGFPITRAQLHSGPLYITVAPKQLQSFISFWNGFKDSISNDDSDSIENNRKSSTVARRKDSIHVKTNDDIRNGSFKFVHDWDGHGALPEPGEVVFGKDATEKQGTMTWCYSEPRVITKVDVYPVPLKPQNQEEHSVLAEEINCSLQYWDYQKQCFVNYQHFRLVESCSQSLDLPFISLDTVHEIACTDRWRVTLECDNPEAEHLPVLPNVLAACMRVDSLFDPVYIPTMRVTLDIDMVQITFCNHFRNGNSPDLLFPFQIDGQMVQDQEFMIVNFDSGRFSFSKWFNKQVVNANCSIGCELIDYRNLTLQPLLDPVDIQTQTLFTYHYKKRPVIESELNIHPCYVRVGQSAIHTLNIATQSWNQIFDNPTLKELCKHIIPNYYIVCNNTHENIRFGQVGTEETILLTSQKYHAYSWRSSSQQMLRVCLESMHWKWCEPFSIDTVGIKVRVMECKGQSLTLVLRVEKLNNVQKQVIITGQIVVTSRLDFPLDVRLFNQKATTTLHNCESRLPQFPSCLNALSTLPAYLLHSSGTPLACVQVRQQEIEAPWSENILLLGSKAKKHQIIEIPGHKSVKIWCHIQSQEILPYLTIYVVILAPLYVLRNHLSTPVLVHIEKPGSETFNRTVIEISGRGKDYQISSDLILNQTSTTENAQLLFQLAAGMETSSPAIELTQPEDNEHENNDDKEFSLETACYNWLPLEPYIWPYDNRDKESELSKLLRRNVLTLYDPPAVSPNAVEVPDTVLNICFYKPWPKVNTVLVDIKPWALLVNRSTIDLFLKDPAGHEWLLSKDAVLTPPLLQNPFAIGLETDAQIWYSRTMTINQNVENEDEEEIKICQDLELTSESVTQISIWIPTMKKVCTLLIDVKIREKVHIITVKPQVYICNNTSKSLNLVSSISPSFIVPLVKPEMSREVVAKNEDDIPLMLWNCDSPLDKFPNYNYCLSLSIREELPAIMNVFSYPIFVSSLKQGSSFRKTVSLSNRKGLFIPFVLTFHWYFDSLYVVIKNDQSPFMCLHNYTNQTLSYGQSVESSASGSVTVLEETVGFSPIPSINAGEVVFYTFPLVNSSFPTMLSKLPSLHLSKSIEKSEEPKKEVKLAPSWCPPIDICQEVDHFVHIPDVGDVRIHKEKVGHTMHIFLESVNRVEVSAKEIRSRIGNPCKPARHTSEVKALPKQIKEPSPIDSPTPKLAFTIELPKPALVKKQPIYFLSILANHLCGIIFDNVTTPQESRELLRISIDRLCLLLRPSEVSPSRISSYSVTRQDVTLCVGSVQVDNQLAHGRESSNTDYDFTVLLIPDNQKSLVLSMPKDISTLNYIAKCTESSFITVNLALARINSKHESDTTLVIEKLKAEVKPVALYLEDSLYYHMLQVLAKTEISSFSTSHVMTKEAKIPKSIMALAVGLSNPLPIVELEIKPLTVLVSLHASLKLFLAIDHSPLSFRAFQNHNLFTSSYQLGQLLTVHYLTGALLRAGWVVGSLDLLGNPAGLARALSSGVSDMVLLPYRGILQGPWAFLTGMSHGTVSFLKQISSGAVTSVTNMASSISRNMDKLSLDNEHLKRQNIMRRQSVDGLTTGLKQGLSGFGISLLGAVAGLVDQPLQAVISENVASSKGAAYVFKAATGIVGGASKGIVGMVVKPIGGAAELISQTGQGLLQGVGWQTQPNPRYLPISSNIAAQSNTLLKYSWKLLHSGLGKEALFALEATHLTSSGHRVSDILVLTSQVLCVVNKEMDNQEQTFSITEIDCLACPTDSSLIFVTLKPSQESVMPEVDKETKDRVAEYVSKISSEFGHNTLLAEEGEAACYQEGVVWRDAYQFCVYPKLRDHFLTLFQIEQFKAMGKRYPV